MIYSAPLDGAPLSICPLRGPASTDLRGARRGASRHEVRVRHAVLPGALQPAPRDVVGVGEGVEAMGKLNGAPF